MILPKATTAYLLILASLTLIPVSVMLTSPVAHAMVPFNSYQELQDYIKGTNCASPTPSPNTRGTYTATPGTFGANSASASSSSSSGPPGHSETNQQVQGVDELDTVKNDGQYVYTITNNSVAIVQAYQTTDAKLLSKVTVNGSLQGIFVVGNKLVIVSQIPGYSPILYYGGGVGVPTPVTGLAQPSIATIYSYPFSQITSLYVVDISNHASPVVTTRIDVNGTLAGARLIGSDVYLVASQPVYCYDKIILPEQIVNGQVMTMMATQVYHSDVLDHGYSFTTIIGLDTSQSIANPTAKIYLIGSTGTIYVSLHDIFLTQLSWDTNQQTIVHRVSIDGLAINYEATGTVPGHTLNQFSMDEYNGYLRVATTDYGFQPTPLGLSASSVSSVQETNVYVLDKSLHTVGKLEGLSPGEQMYSARFLGDRAYLVTYKRMDPLFVIGLTQPTRPVVLGHLNVTGVSDCLQPYDETHLIGIGQSGTDVAWENAVRFTGLKISLFNVTDPNNPSETSRYTVGGPGSTSPAINDHKAVLFDQSLNLLVIPISLTAQPPSNATWYSYQLVWQGAYVFTVTPNNGIVFRGGVSQFPSGQTPTYSNSPQFITRTLYIGNVLYTISDNNVQMNSLSDLSLIGSVSLA